MKTLIRTSLLLFLGGLCFGQSNPGGGGSGAPASVTLLSKTGTYAGSTSDFSNGSTPPTIVEFSLSAIGQTYTLLSSAPTKVGGNMPCTILKDVTAPYILSVLTGGSTTLDGVAFASVGFPLGPGQSIVVCSDGTNYHTQGGLGVAQSLIANTGGDFLPYYPQLMSNSKVSAYAGTATITGSVTSGTIGSGHTMTQATTGVTCTSTNAPTGTQSLTCNNFNGYAGGSHLWTDGTTSGTYTPTAFPAFPGNVINAFAFHLGYTAKVTNITYGYAVPFAGSNGDWGIADSSGNMLTHISGGVATTSTTGNVATVSASPAIILPPGNYILGLCDTDGTTFQFTGIAPGGDVFGNWGAQVASIGTITGSVTSGTIGAGHTMTQASTGATCTSLNAPTGSQSLTCNNFNATATDGTHTWTDGTTSGVYTPTAVPSFSSAAVVGAGTMATSCTSGVLPSTWGAFTAAPTPDAIPVILVGP
jgi:hypothetical protein